MCTNWGVFDRSVRRVDRPWNLELRGITLRCCYFVCRSMSSFKLYNFVLMTWWNDIGLARSLSYLHLRSNTFDLKDIFRILHLFGRRLVPWALICGSFQSLSRWVWREICRSYIFIYNLTHSRISLFWWRSTFLSVVAAINKAHGSICIFWHDQQPGPVTVAPYVWGVKMLFTT